MTAALKLLTIIDPCPEVVARASACLCACSEAVATASASLCACGAERGITGSHVCSCVMMFGRMVDLSPNHLSIPCAGTSMSSSRYNTRSPGEGSKELSSGLVYTGTAAQVARPTVDRLTDRPPIAQSTHPSYSSLAFRRHRGQRSRRARRRKSHPRSKTRRYTNPDVMRTRKMSLPC